jgi:hypothetical protein
MARRQSNVDATPEVREKSNLRGLRSGVAPDRDAALRAQRLSGGTTRAARGQASKREPAGPCDRRGGARPEHLASYRHAAQSARKTFSSPGAAAFRLAQKTSLAPSRENMGNDAKPSAWVTRSRPEPSTLTR